MHSINPKNAVSIIESNKLSARTTQRYWKDSRTRKDTDPQYETSCLMKGWSMTRDFTFAAAWNTVVFEFNKDELKQQFKIRPISWNATMNGLRNHKKEREEFVIAKLTGKTFNDFKDAFEKMQDDLYKEYEKTNDRTILHNFPYEDVFDLIKSPDPKTISMDLCKGIYLDENILERYSPESDTIKKITSHPLFKGYYNGDTLHRLNQENKEAIQRLINQSNSKKRMKL